MEAPYVTESLWGLCYTESLSEGPKRDCVPVVHGGLTCPLTHPVLVFMSYFSPLLAMVFWENSQINNLHISACFLQSCFGGEEGEKMFFSGLSPVNWTDKRQISKRETEID